MKKILIKIISYLLLKIVSSRDNREKVLIWVYSVFRINIDMFFYNRNGILNWKTKVDSGESNLISNVLKKHLINNKKLIFFDVGGNVGQYSDLLRKSFPNATVHLFEPLPEAYKKACDLHKDFENVKLYNLGLSEKQGSSIIHTYNNAIDSEHASLHKKVISDIHNGNDVLSIEIKLETLDNFIYTNNINHIHFMKIDTEGHELSVLKGAIRTILIKGIDFIQFEFNEMNVISRVFFKDFYDLFVKYKYYIYRLNPKHLEPITEYNTKYEIFKFQNFLASVNKLDD